MVLLGAPLTGEGISGVNPELYREGQSFDKRKIIWRHPRCFELLV
jgi:hypothetical protein